MYFLRFIDNVGHKKCFNEDFIDNSVSLTNVLVPRRVTIHLSDFTRRTPFVWLDRATGCPAMFLLFL